MNDNSRKPQSASLTVNGKGGSESNKEPRVSREVLNKAIKGASAELSLKTAKTE